MFGRVLDTGIVVGILIIIVTVVMTLANSTDTKQVVQNEPINTQKEDKSTQQEIEKTASRIAESLPEYQKTNEILKMYSTEEILQDILDDKTTALDYRIEYHSMTEPKDGTNKEDLSYIAGEIEYEATACEQNKHATDISGLVQVLRLDLEYAIKSGYAKDPSITPTLQRIKEAISAYSDCTYKSEIQDLQTTTLNNGFDPALVKASKENIPKIQNVAKGILNECRKVKSYSDYQTFAAAVSLSNDKLIEFADGTDAILSELENRGYDKHPEVGPLIEETRDLYFETSLCIAELVNKYEN